jgi:hydroxymethylpyrimidine pyrophosphatase-like HAD family hydrolase
MEILPPGADKGHALAWVAERYGIARERVMAVGDSGNDIGMLSWAGIACCPADARADVRAITPHIAEKPHEEGAVAELLERFIFQAAG